MTDIPEHERLQRELPDVSWVGRMSQHNGCDCSPDHFMVAAACVSKGLCVE